MLKNDYMNKYKSEFIIKFASLMQDNLSQWKKDQKVYRKNLYTGDLKWYLISFCAGYIPGKHETNYLNNLTMHFWIGVVFFIIAIFIAINIENKDYQNAVKSTFYQKLLKVFGEKIFYCNHDAVFLMNILSKDEESQEEVEEIYKDLNLYPESAYPKTIPNGVFQRSGLYDKYKQKITERNDDDCFYGEFNNVEFNINETDFGYKRKDKNETYVQMFKGVAMHFKMNKKINTRVLVYSKGSNWLTNPIHFASKVPEGYEKINLEYEKFNKKYDVYAYKTFDHEGQVEARYLFNTAFLDRFMQLQTSFRVSKLECSVKDDDLLIMLSTNRDLFEMNHLLGKVDDVSQYKNLFNEFASVLSFIDVLNLSSKTRL